jgi:hypothetical protein
MIKNINYTILLLFTICLLMACSGTKSVPLSADKDAIAKVLRDQEKAWSAGNIEAFMEGYWKDEQLTFIGRSGVSYSWATTLSNYKKNYPDKAAMGILSFNIIELRPITKGAYYMIGKYTLKRAEDEPSGFFSLVWEKKNGNWVITSDHTSG